MTFIARLFLLANLLTVVPAVAPSGGLLRGGISRDSTREPDDSDFPRENGANLHHREGHVTAGKIEQRIIGVSKVRGARELDDSDSPQADGEQAGHISAERIQQRIIGGSKAPSRRYLYTVALMDNRDSFCGGVLISKDVVLTAAHCAHGRKSVVIFAGSSHLPDSNAVQNGEFVFARKSWIHPKFSLATVEYDFAVYLLDEPVSSNVEVVTMNDDSRNPSRGEQLVALGWGDTTKDTSTVRESDDLMKVGVDYVPNNECKSRYVSNNYVTYKYQIADSMLCAHDTGKDSCQGDSGGPLIIEGTNSSGRKDVLVGLTSWGVMCAHETLPGVYARVSVGYEWIKSIVCEHSHDPPDSFSCSGKDNASNGDKGDSSGKGGNNNGKGYNGGKGSNNGKGNNGKGSDNSDKGGNNGKGSNGGKGGNKGKGVNGDRDSNKGKGNNKGNNKKRKKKNKKNKKKRNKKEGDRRDKHNLFS